ncbi:MAG: hypothetical protein Q9P01_00720 [Anaerolineae bacterium]|nr:hypothetical protein [Anaerolineae bacterium]
MTNPQEIREQVNEDTTLAGSLLQFLNGGNADDVVAQAVAVITERVNEGTSKRRYSRRQCGTDLRRKSRINQVTDFVLNGEGYLARVVVALMVSAVVALMVSVADKHVVWLGQLPNRLD